MTLKTVGAVIIFCVCTYAGIYKGDRLKKRCVYLRNIQTALNILETEIAFGGSRLKRAFEILNDAADTCGLFKAAAENLEEQGIRYAWKKAVEEKRTKMCLSDTDIQVMEVFGEKLGMTDTENQIKNIKYVRELLASEQKKAEGDYEQLGRIYRSGGVLGGLFLILILF